MSEKLQHTAASMREKMRLRYDDGLHHKHDKSHHLYRLHYRSHPVQLTRLHEEKKKVNESTGLIHTMNLRKLRKRLDKGHIH